MSQARRLLSHQDRLWHLGALLAIAGSSLSCTEETSPRTEATSAPEWPSVEPLAPLEPATPAAPPPPEPVTSPSSAALPCRDEDGVVKVSVEVRSQEDIERLAGCERLVGDLFLYARPGLDYTPLRSLRDVEGTLVVRDGDAPLEGLSGLEEAGGLELSNLQVANLEPLSGLRRLGVSTSQLPPPSETIDEETGLEDISYVSFFGLAINNCAGLTSLAGLHSLEELDALHLANNPDLVSLGGLSGLVELPELQLISGVVDLRGGVPVRRLSVSHSPWTDLTALGDTRVLESLELRDNPALASLAGARLPARLELLSLRNNPALASLDGLTALRSIDQLLIVTASWSSRVPVAESRLTSVEGLSGLERVGDLYLHGQTRLRSLAGLAALREIESVNLSDNPALQSLEGLSGLERAGSFFMLGSPLLTTLSGLGSAQIGMLQLLDLGIVDLTGLEQVSVDLDLSILRAPELVSLRGLPQLGPDASVSLIDVPALTDAQALEAVTALGALTLERTSLAQLAAPGLQRLRLLTVWENPELVQLSLGALSTIDQLRLLANHSLARLDLRQLQAVQELEITNNSQLYEPSLAPLLELGAAPAVIERNGWSPARLDPCPWTGDGRCDETNGVCAVGTDAADCGGP